MNRLGSVNKEKRGRIGENTGGSGGEPGQYERPGCTASVPGRRIRCCIGTINIKTMQKWKGRYHEKENLQFDAGAAYGGDYAAGDGDGYGIK